ncbi:unnamed protein product [Anisakis simplex]|uniref:ADF-H domain-containing protein n=1 Tax=Anisakis simplex TaxID=6269 RepID=A0A0M3JGR5_ANISI|nr:unnamed protein product [Anisakis simplex]VDK54457.1 unnamed protein product [Anisakis simplex]
MVDSSENFKASGVKVDASCKKAYDDLHNRHLHAFIIFRISDDDTTIIVDKLGEKGAPYSDFVEVREFFIRFESSVFSGNADWLQSSFDQRGINSLDLIYVNTYKGSQ